MASSIDKSYPSRGLAAALRRFPARRRQIEGLFKVDEEFRGLCDDLADAETALQQTGELPIDIRFSRRIEYQELVESLSLELKEVVLRTNVVLFRP